MADQLDRERIPASPMEITCPRCLRAPGDRCRTESGGLLGSPKVHQARVKAAGGG